MSMKPSEILKKLRELLTEIEGYTILETADARSLARMAAATDPDMVTSATAALEMSDEIQTAVGCTPERLRDKRATYSEWTAVEAELYKLYRGVAHAQLIRRHQIGLITASVFQIARQLVRQPRYANLISIVDTMRRQNKFGRRRKPRPESEPVSE